MEKTGLLKICLLMLFTAFLAAGCWDSMDINDRNIVTAVVIDKTDYGYAYYVEIPQITGSSQSGEGTKKAKPVIAKSEGRTFIEARETLDQSMDKPVFLGAVQAVVLTDRLANCDIEEYMLRLRQFNDYRKTVHVVITEEDPETLLNDVTENADSVGFAIESMLAGLAENGGLLHISLMDVYKALSSPYRGFILPTIALVNREPAFVGYTVFSGGKKVSFIPAAEIKSIVFMQSNNSKAQYVVPYGDTEAAVEVTLKDKSVKPYDQDGKISFDAALRFNATLMYPENADPVTESDMEAIGSYLQAMLEQEFNRMFKKSQEEYQYDCFRLRTYFRIAYPKEYEKMDWASEYPNVTANFSIDVVLSPNNSIDYNPEG